MNDRRLRIKSETGLGRDAEIVIIEPDGSERQVPKLRRATFSVSYDDAATAMLEAIDIDLTGEGVLIEDKRHRVTEADVLRLLQAFSWAVANLAQCARMYPEACQRFAAEQFRERNEELRRWLSELAPLPDTKDGD